MNSPPLALNCLTIMVNEKSCLYDKLPLELLAGFYFEKNKNIEKGICLMPCIMKLD